MSCKHEKVCTECVRDEISKLEEKVAELKRKLPHEHTHIIIQKEYVPVPRYPQWTLTGPQAIYMTCENTQTTGFLHGDLNSQLLA